MKFLVLGVVVLRLFHLVTERGVGTEKVRSLLDSDETLGYDGLSYVNITATPNEILDPKNVFDTVNQRTISTKLSPKSHDCLLVPSIYQH